MEEMFETSLKHFYVLKRRGVVVLVARGEAFLFKGDIDVVLEWMLLFTFYRGIGLSTNGGLIVRSLECVL